MLRFMGSIEQVKMVEQIIADKPYKTVWCPLDSRIRHDGSSQSEQLPGEQSSVYTRVYEIFMDTRVKGSFAEWNSWIDFIRWWNTDEVQIRFVYNHRDGQAHI